MARDSSDFLFRDPAMARVVKLAEQVEAIRTLPGTFPTVAEVLPTFEAMIAPDMAIASSLRSSISAPV